MINQTLLQQLPSHLFWDIDISNADIVAMKLKAIAGKLKVFKKILNKNSKGNFEFDFVMTIFVKRIVSN